ncbi:TraR/DksA C4-type zinc finger protein [Paenibacillus segetis]|uniref:Zinc finger DksA/TraR C4-type domain-containing protein n=1 Tax=Paenibacillus segetis TaxID=1325360 RepID=A0ABQ1YJA2_9BACL|nr:TraR/DksA C4-type zinc finger protein [Paenibacillus segetis]GGH26213.1 hypothetical protein GCM10008013_26940 [Paenibacillus segetis]
MPHLTQYQLTELKSKLQADQESLKERLTQNDHYGVGQSLRDNTSEFSSLDNHPADIGTELFEREKDLALCDHDELQLTRIEDALERIDKGNYGVCVTCGNPISFQRLSAIPETAYCKEHSPQSVVSTDRPVEEEILSPPFGRTSMDEYENPGFDGEDTWQILEAYGTSTSPAYSEDADIGSYDDMGIESDREMDGFVESYESYVATDIYGQNVFFYRNGQYQELMSSTEHLDSEDSLGTGPNTY